MENRKKNWIDGNRNWRVTGPAERWNSRLGVFELKAASTKARNGESTEKEKP